MKEPNRLNNQEYCPECGWAVLDKPHVCPPKWIVNHRRGPIDVVVYDRTPGEAARQYLEFKAKRDLFGDKDETEVYVRPYGGGPRYKVTVTREAFYHYETKDVIEL